MIDTDKYEGHTEGEWHVDDDGVGLIIKWGGMPHDFVDMENKANAQLMADAPILLQALMDERAEVKRLREANDDLIYELQGFQEAVKEDEAGYKDLVASLEGIEEELKAEVKQLRKTNEFHMMLDAEETKEQLKLQKENDNLTKLCIERYAEVKRLRDELKFVVEMLEGKPSNMEWYECRNLILEQVVVDLDD